MGRSHAALYERSADLDVGGRRVERHVSPLEREITRIDHDGSLTVRLDGSGGSINLTPESLRLAYAQHVYHQQGATVEHAIVLTGGWQTSKETAYVQPTRARNGTDWHVARDQLGEDGQDPDRIDRLAQRMTNSRLHTPSIAYDELRDTAWEPARDPLRLSRRILHGDWLMRTPAREAPDHDFGRGR